MTLNTQQIWKTYADEFFFFVLKRVRNEDSTREIIQNSFYKIHSKLGSLKDETKVRAWAFQIVRNEINNYYAKPTPVFQGQDLPIEAEMEIPDSYCCFEKFLDQLPEIYYVVMEQVYLKGNPQTTAATNLNLSLANVKARIRRAKDILKKNFQECCKYDLDPRGLLVGEPDCSSCQNA